MSQRLFLLVLCWEEPPFMIKTNYIAHTSYTYSSIRYFLSKTCVECVLSEIDFTMTKTHKAKKLTRTKVVYKNVCQGCHKIRKSESKKAMHPLHSIKVIICDLKSYFFVC